MMHPATNGYDEEEIWTTRPIREDQTSSRLGREEDVGAVLPTIVDGDSELRRRSDRRCKINDEEEERDRREEYWMGWVGTAARFLPERFLVKTKEDTEESASRLPGWANSISYDCRANKWPLLLAAVCTVFCLLLAVKWTESLHDQSVNGTVKLNFVYPDDDKYDDWLRDECTRTYNVPIDDDSFHLGRIKVPIYQKTGETTITFENIVKEMRESMESSPSAKICVSSAELGIPVNLILILITIGSEEKDAERRLLIDPVITQNSSKTVEIESGVSFPSQSRIEYKNAGNKKERITTKARLTHCVMNGIKFNTKYRGTTVPSPPPDLEVKPAQPSPPPPPSPSLDSSSLVLE